MKSIREGTSVISVVVKTYVCTYASGAMNDEEVAAAAAAVTVEMRRRVDQQATSHGTHRPTEHHSYNSLSHSLAPSSHASVLTAPPNTATASQKALAMSS